MAGEIKELRLRIVELENQLDQLKARREPADISAEELKAYRKVHDILHADYGELCGINDCQPCVVTRCAVDPVRPGRPARHRPRTRGAPVRDAFRSSSRAGQVALAPAERGVDRQQTGLRGHDGNTERSA